MLTAAILFATEKHATQVRKGSTLAYISHPLSVAASIKRFLFAQKAPPTHVDTMMSAAVLHDVAEDCNVPIETFKTLFGSEIAGLVAELTSDRNEIKTLMENLKISKTAAKTLYLMKKMAAVSDDALALKLCDRLDNVQDAPTKECIESTIEIIAHLVKTRALTPIHHAIIKELNDAITL